MELHRKKNVATYIFFPLVDANGALVSCAANLDSEVDTFADGTVPDGFADLTNEATEIGSSGWYYLSLTQAEMNFDYIAIKITSDDALTQNILINTKPLTEIGVIDGIVDDILTDTGTTIPGTITTIDTEVGQIKAVTDNLPNSGALSDIDTGVNNIEAKLPTNYIMGSSDQADHDGDFDTIVTDLDDIKGTGFVKDTDSLVDIRPETDKIQTIDDNVDAILVDTDTLEADLKTYLDAIETNLEGDIEDNDILIDAVKTVVDAIQTKTDNLPADPASETNVNANETKIDTMQGNITSILEDTGTTLPATLGTLATSAALSTHDGKLDTVDAIVDAIKVLTDNLPVDTDTVLTRILGLLKQNMVIDFTFDGSDDNTQAVIYLYDSAAHATTHDGTTGLIGKYTMTATYSNSLPSTMKQVKNS